MPDSTADLIATVRKALIATHWRGIGNSPFGRNQRGALAALDALAAGVFLTHEEAVIIHELLTTTDVLPVANTAWANRLAARLSEAKP